MNVNKVLSSVSLGRVERFQTEGSMSHRIEFPHVKSHAKRNRYVFVAGMARIIPHPYVTETAQNDHN